MRTEMTADSMIPSEEVKEDDYKYELSYLEDDVEEYTTLIFILRHILTTP